MLKLSEGFLKNLTKGTKRGKDDFVRMNTANCCRSVAFFTGYKDEERARKAISANVKLLYTSSETYARKLQKLASKYGEVKKRILLDAAKAIKANNFQEYNRLINSDKDLKKTYKRKCMKSVNKKLVDKLRTSKKTNRQTAKQILMSVGSKDGYKIIAPKEKIEKEIAKRVKRYGSVASLFWHSAKQLNPKIKPSDKKHTLNKNKRKKHKLINGMSYKTSTSNKEVSARVNHIAEKLNSSFVSKLQKRIKSQEKFWAKQAEKQIVAAAYFNKLIERI